MLRIYNQNIWGNYSETEAVANRNQLLLELITENQPDICCLQECNPNTSRVGEEGVQLLLKEQYSEASEENWERNYTPVFYKKDKFKLIDSGFQIYSGTTYDRSKSVTWAVLEEISTGKRVGVASTHFWFKHTGEVDIKQREDNAATLTQVCEEMIRKYQVPVIATGDLNHGIYSRSGEAVPYKNMLENGFQDVRFTAKESTDSHTCHHYPKRNEEGIYVEADEPMSTIDFILTYGENPLKAESFRVLRDHKALVSSDHCPMIAEFGF